MPYSSISLKYCKSIILLIILASFVLRLAFIGTTNLLVEEAYYWNYSTHLDFSYLDHPPMVAVLIHVATLILGTNEFSIHLPSVFCWMATAYFSFSLTQLIVKGAGKYSVFLLSVLPFFFIHSIIMTPDQPLSVCWAAVLYYLYRALVLNESQTWYVIGLWFGLGLLSKYTIVLLAPIILFYMLFVPGNINWFVRKEPYICILIIVLLFTPVIYWNATHAWVSFMFQSSRRFNATGYFSLPSFLGILGFFLMPLGLRGLKSLNDRKNTHNTKLEPRSKKFIQFFTIGPLLFFGLFSLTHAIKFNWIGPGLLALIPWLAILMQLDTQFKLLKGWLITAIILLSGYGITMLGISYSVPEIINKEFLSKFIDWRDLTYQLHTVATKAAAISHQEPIFVPLDTYNLSSELTFYQADLVNIGKIKTTYAVLGRHIFGDESLMFRYWNTTRSLANNLLILVAKDRNYFYNPKLHQRVMVRSLITKIWAHSQGKTLPITPYYYQIAQIKNDTL